MKQTLCPYTTDLLANAALVNNEHILPVAIGAPANFHVLADASMNSEMNDLIDSPFSNDPMIRFLAMSQGVKSRSGPVTATVRGVVKSTNDDVEAVFSRSSVDVKFRKPVVTDPATGSVSMVKGFGEQAASQAAAVLKNYARKGIHVELGDTVTAPDSSLQMGMNLNTNLLRQQLFKIAYLMTVRNWGDQAILSKSGEMYRQALRVTGDDAYGEIGFKGGVTSPLPPILQQPACNEHLLVTFVQSGYLVCVITLFGTFTASFISPAEGIQADEAEGEYIILDATTSKIHSRTFLDELQRASIASA